MDKGGELELMDLQVLSLLGNNSVAVWGLGFDFSNKASAIVESSINLININGSDLDVFSEDNVLGNSSNTLDDWTSNFGEGLSFADGHQSTSDCDLVFNTLFNQFSDNTMLFLVVFVSIDQSVEVSL